MKKVRCIGLDFRRPQETSPACECSIDTFQSPREALSVTFLLLQNSVACWRHHILRVTIFKNTIVCFPGSFGGQTSSQWDEMTFSRVLLGICHMLVRCFVVWFFFLQIRIIAIEARLADFRPTVLASSHYVPPPKPKEFSKEAIDALHILKAIFSTQHLGILWRRRNVREIL